MPISRGFGDILEVTGADAVNKNIGDGMFNFILSSVPPRKHCRQEVNL